MIARQDTVTEKIRCEAWRESLPTRSHSDTAETQDQIGRAWAVWEAACEGGR